MGLSSAERQKQYRARNPERSRSSWRQYALTEKGTITVLLNYARDRARRQGLAFDLKLAAGTCELTGISLERLSPGQHRTHPYAPSLDRIEPALGYTKPNVRLVCFAVNRARSDWGDEVILRIAQALVKKHITA